MFKSDLLSSVSCISHGFFSRNGGVSGGVYSSLNVSFSVGDDFENVRQNRNIIKNYFKKEKLVTLKQLHSTNVVLLGDDITEEESQKIEADAIITRTPNLIIGVLTADCMPILLVDTKNNSIGAIHAGWKGLINGVIEKTIHKMKKLAEYKPNILVAIGPCIKKESYEVDVDFYKTCISNHAAAGIFFAKKPDNKFLFDIVSYAHKKIVDLGINKKNIDILNDNTYSNEVDFFSHRRTTHRGEKFRGLQISCITINKKS